MNGRATGSRALVGCLVFAFSAVAFAQVQTGSISGVARGADGSPAGGATVTITGQHGPPQTVTARPDGGFDAIGLPPGPYTVRIQRGGQTVTKNVRVSMGTTALVNATTPDPPVEDIITVTAESPLLEERRIPTGRDAPIEVDKVPTARDPWAILQMTPGVLADRINVGGADTGQLGQVTGPGAPPAQTQWSVDGVVITDMAALGATPAYYDFDTFEEMQVTTGGAALTKTGSGVTVNMVTKRGTNEWRGSGRFYLGNGFGDELPDALGTGAGGTMLNNTVDYGAELGGAIVRDRLWIWGSYGAQKIDLLTIGSDARYDRDVSRFTFSGNLNGRLGLNNRPTFTFHFTDRSASGLSEKPIRSETAFTEESRPSVVKLEDTHIFSSNFYLTGLYSLVNGGFQVAPQSIRQPLLTEDGIERGFFEYDATRNIREFRLDGGTFFNSGNLRHELKFGAGFRSSTATDTGRWPGDLVNLPFEDQTFFLRTPIGTRSADLSTSSFYAQDTLRARNFTFNFGLRYDGQKASTGDSSMTFPFSTSFPPVRFTTEDSFDVGSILPRAGLTYAPGADGRTLLRASYARFADTLTGPQGFLMNPIEPLPFGGAEFFRYTDLNRNRSFDPAEPSVSLGFPSGAPNDSSILDRLNRVDDDLKAPVTDELLFGIEHALLPEFVVGLNLTYRKIDNLFDQIPLVEGATIRPATGADYVPGEVLSGSFNIPGLGTGSYNTTIPALRPNLFDTGGSLLTNSDRGQTYRDTSISFNKRLANRWMLRGHVTWSNWEWSDAEDAAHRRTDIISRAASGVVAPASGVAGREQIFINSRWSYAANGLYQVSPDRPWGFNLSGSAYGRQGFPAPLLRVANGEAVPVLDFDAFRYESPFLVDLKAAKTIEIGGRGVQFSVETFNLFDNRPVLQRDLNLGHPTAGRPFDVQQGRVLRFGARFSFE